MPRNVERRASQNSPVSKNVRQYLAEQHHRALSVGAEGRRGASWIYAVYHRVGLILFNLEHFTWRYPPVCEISSRPVGNASSPSVDLLHNDLYQFNFDE